MKLRGKDGIFKEIKKWTKGRPKNGFYFIFPTEERLNLRPN